ncbi:alpha-ketoglutarate-dependent dioxygenase AlkB [Lysobacter sp. N42]|nr:alpha-ketoglutarate-dependent dioxygenase AlkB [Aliidiomarina sp. B3213]TCZ90323.1 alpha-ketoglutarate-dependent dioxygenase AlkB [Lysobacter sp. N42]
MQYISNWLDQGTADDLYSCLKAELAWHQGDVLVFGKWHKTPRLQAFHGDPGLGYAYSGKALDPQPWTPALNQIRAKLAEIQLYPNVMLGNWYRDGNDKMGWHRDNEPELGRNPIVISLSFGASRDFHLRHVETKQRETINLGHGSLLIMGGTSQHFWEHQLPQRKRVHDGRINLTFRTIFAPEQSN